MGKANRTDRDRDHPGQCGVLCEQHVTTADAFNREMVSEAMRYRMIYVPWDGAWVLEDTLSGDCLHIAPTADETMAVHIMRAWIYGMNYEQGVDLCRKHLRGELPDDNASPY